MLTARVSDNFLFYLFCHPVMCPAHTPHSIYRAGCYRELQRCAAWIYCYNFTITRWHRHFSTEYNLKRTTFSWNVRAFGWRLLKWIARLFARHWWGPMQFSQHIFFLIECLIRNSVAVLAANLTCMSTAVLLSKAPKSGKYSISADDENKLRQNKHSNCVVFRNQHYSLIAMTRAFRVLFMSQNAKQVRKQQRLHKTREWMQCNGVSISRITIRMQSSSWTSCTIHLLQGKS